MPRPYIVKHLDAARIQQAFPLVHAADANLSLGQWTRFASYYLAGGQPPPDPSRGIVSVESEHGYIHGLFLYSVDSDLRHGRSLRCDNVVAVEMFDAGGVAATILEAINSLAREHDCRAIRVSLHNDGGALHTLLEGAGHIRDSVVFCKPVGVGAAS